MSGETAPVVDLDISEPEILDSVAQEAQELALCEGVHPLSSGYFSMKLRNAGEWIASRPWGQMLFKSVDRVLWCVERTLLWQHPSAVPLKLSPMDKPVNCVIAHPLAAFLWILQHLMFVGGDSSDDSSKGVQMIKWVRTRRRRLRAVRFLGIRNMRRDNVLGRPVKCGAFAQVLWFLGLLPVSKKVEEEQVKDAKEVEEINASSGTPEKAELEQTRKRTLSDLLSTDDGALSLDEYNSESDSDYVPDFDHSSESSESEDDSSSDDDEKEDTKSEKVEDADEKVESETQSAKTDEPTKEHQ